MTSQVVLSNGFGVAIASDSAMTFGESRTYDTAEKVFPVPAPHQIAALHSGSVFFHEMPFQSLFSEWCRSLPAEPLPTVNEYASHFLAWLVQTTPKISTQNQINLYGSIFNNCLGEIWGDYQEILKNGSDDPLGNIKEKVRQLTVNISSWKPVANMNSDLVERLFVRHAEWNQGRIDFYFDDCESDEELEKISLQYVKQTLLTGYWANVASLAFCGYGKTELLPATFQVDIYGALDKTPMWRVLDQSSFSAEHGGKWFHILPLGQTAAIHEFLKGIDSQVFEIAEEIACDASDIGESSMKEFLEASFIEQHAPLQLTAQIQFALQNSERLAKVGKEVRELANNRLTKHMEETRLERLREVVAGIPTATLASVAQSLISIVPLRQALSGELGTVGGPIDVATITRAEGFKWVQHKSIGL